MALATIAQVEAIVGYSLTSQAVRVDQLLNLADRLVTAEMRYVIEPTPIPAEVTLVTAGIVARALANPTGVVQDTSGPFTVRYADDTEPGLYLTRTERDRLARVRAGATAIRGLWTLGTTRGDEIYMPVEEYDPFAAGWPA